MLNKVEKLFAKVMGGTSTEREIKRITPIVIQINEIAESYIDLTDEELKAKTQEFRYRLRTGETLDDLLPEAFAVVKETCRRLLGTKWIVRGHEIEWNMVPYDVQIMGAIVLHEGKIAEMATGEGKTLVATMPLYLNALLGKGAHLITVNDYLAQRDREWMGKIYEFLGLTTAAIFGNQDPRERKMAYSADITYGTNNEFGFDYLRDNMAVDVWGVVQRELFYAIVDEVDSVLIDEARTPLIISGAVGAPRNVYLELKPIVANLYLKQKELVSQLIQEGKALLEKDEEQAGLLLLRAQRGNPKDQNLLDLLTSEFWVKKLIERIQGRFEVDKAMGEVDAELYYTIDEKSHIIDITEKGRIFLSGGRDLDIAYKIQKLDEVDAVLSTLSEKKKFDRYFSQDQITGLCNGLTLEGKLALCDAKGEVSEEEVEAVDRLVQRLNLFSGEINSGSKGDKGSAGRRYYNVAKKMDRAVNGLTDEGREFLFNSATGDIEKGVIEAFDNLLTVLRSGADVDAGFTGSRHEIERRRQLQNTFFEIDKQYGYPSGLTEEGRIALFCLLHDGDPLLVPTVTLMESMIKNTGSEGQSGQEILSQIQEFFDLSDNGAAIKHITEKGRIALLGGNPELYVLPDRGLVEERDHQVQQLLDNTLNLSNYDYAEKVLVIEQLEKEIQWIYEIQKSTAHENDSDLFYEKKADDESVARVTMRPLARAILADYAEQTKNLAAWIDRELRDRKGNEIFRRDDRGNLNDIHSEVLDRWLGLSFKEVEKGIREWQQLQAGDGGQRDNPVQLRLSLDDFLDKKLNGSSADGMASLSRRFEEIRRMSEIIKRVFSDLTGNDLTVLEKQRLVRRYFEIGNSPSGSEVTGENLEIEGLTDSGIQLLSRLADHREFVTDQLFKLLDEVNNDLTVLFDCDAGGYPRRFLKSSLSQLLGGLPYFRYSDELQRFRDDVLFFSNKKVNSRSEFEGLLKKDKAQLRAKHYLFDDRELNEILFKAHAPNYVISGDEIETWFRTHFERKPRRVLEGQVDRMWNEYNRVEERIQNISQLLRAYTLYQKDVDYVVKIVEENEMRGRAASARGQKAVMIVDQFTGRLMPGRRFSDGLHEALEAKEGVEVQAESQTLATITLQNFFRLYKKLAGMTGTAETEAQEFFSTYKLDVIVIPTNKPVVRGDFNDVIFRTKREKYDAIIEEALTMHKEGRPILIGTISVDVSQRLSQMFTQRGVPIANWLKKGDVSRELESGNFHTVLNAKFHGQEAEIVAKAGLPGSITIATNMAGRGTDIKLAEGVVEKGGLHIIGSEKHEARRIDRQLRGRAGRQGDPGSSRFYLCLEDDLMRLFGSDRIASIMTRMGSMEEGERIEHPLITKSIERAQKKVEERNFDIRKNLLEYDDVLNEQRKIIYKRRQNLLGFAQAIDFVESKMKRFLDEEDRSKWRIEQLVENLNRFFNTDMNVPPERVEQAKYADIKDMLAEWVDERIENIAHRDQMQVRHRIYGYCRTDLLLAELVRLKIRLHAAGTRDTSRWNITGIRFEIHRIFDSAPDWLENDGIRDDADEIEKKLIDWAQSTHSEMKKRFEEKAGRIVFQQIPVRDLVKIYVWGLMNLHLPPHSAPILWQTDRFLTDLNRVFLQQPNLGANEIRNIRWAKIAEIIDHWINGLTIEEMDGFQIRHRILSYFTPMAFADVVVNYGFRGIDENDIKQVDRLPEEQREYLKRIFGESFDLEPDGALRERAGNTARKVIQTIIQENLDIYNKMMLASAAVEELIEAAIPTIVQMIYDRQLESADSQKQLARYLEYAFLARPDKAFPLKREADVISAYKEELVQWGLNLYAQYAGHVERLRQEYLSSEIVRDSVLLMIEETVYGMISNVLADGSDLSPQQIRKLQSDFRLVFRQSPPLGDDSDEPRNPSDVMDQTTAWAQDLYQRRVEEIGGSAVIRDERNYILAKIDEHWRHHLNGIDELREGIGLRGYGQKDPLLEYKSEAYDMFVKTIDNINRDVVSTLFRYFDVSGEVEERQMAPQNFKETHSQVQIFQDSTSPNTQKLKKSGPEQPVKRTPFVKTARVGRNEPCPCGSGKKYKHCCGRNV